MELLMYVSHPQETPPNFVLYHPSALLFLLQTMAHAISAVLGC